VREGKETVDRTCRHDVRSIQRREERWLQEYGGHQASMMSKHIANRSEQSQKGNALKLQMPTTIAGLLRAPDPKAKTALAKYVFQRGRCTLLEMRHVFQRGRCTLLEMRQLLRRQARTTLMMRACCDFLSSFWAACQWRGAAKNLNSSHRQIENWNGTIQRQCPLMCWSKRDLRCRLAGWHVHMHDIICIGHIRSMTWRQRHCGVAAGRRQTLRTPTIVCCTYRSEFMMESLHRFAWLARAL
jgi:hypothetical protein